MLGPLGELQWKNKCKILYSIYYSSQLSCPALLFFVLLIMGIYSTTANCKNTSVRVCEFHVNNQCLQKQDQNFTVPADIMSPSWDLPSALLVSCTWISQLSHSIKGSHPAFPGIEAVLVFAAKFAGPNPCCSKSSQETHDRLNMQRSAWERTKIQDGSNPYVANSLTVPD